MKIKLLGLLTFVTASVCAQDTVRLELQNVLDAAMKSNREILLANLSQQGAVAKFNQTNVAFLPQINLSYTAMVTINPLNAFAFKLQQQSVSPSDFNPQLLNNPSSTQNYTAKVELNQPLINLDVVYQRRAAKQQIDIFYYKVQRTKEYLTLEVQKAYAQLQLSHEATTVLEEALRTVKSIFETSKNYFEKGYIQKQDLLLVQVKVATIESKLAEAKSNVHNASDYISLLMGTKGGAIYSVAPLEKINQTQNGEWQLPDDRADYKALQSAIKAQELVVRSGKTSHLPKLNAFANYMFNDKTAVGFGSNSYLVGAQFSWNIFNGTSLHYRTVEQKIIYAQLEQHLSYQKEQGQLELNKTIRQLQDAQFALQQREVSVRQSAEALRIHQNRFAQGLVSINDLLQSQSTLSEQKLLLSEAIFKHNTTLAYLQFLTSITENK